jgi:alkylation response protein AidB-like acyl-CoA dehydrogenase
MFNPGYGRALALRKTEIPRGGFSVARRSLKASAVAAATAPRVSSRLRCTTRTEGSTIARVDFRDSIEEARFREEVRAWINENLPDELRGHRGGEARFDGPEVRAWSRALYDAGWVGISWPEAFGGRGLSPRFQALYLEEEARAEAPPHIGVIGLGMAGPTIISRGTDAQKARYLQPLLAADEIWCQGFSEPGAGSDLAGVRTSARLDGDRFVVDGQKVWSSYAHIADFCILLARSDPDSDRHAGLTYLIVDMRAPGVEVRPLRQITGEAEFNEIFLSGVEVPLENVIGEIGGGWDVAMTTLLHERGTLAFALVARLEVQVRKLLALARDRGATPTQREAIAREWIRLQALRLTAYRSLSALERTGIPGPEGSILKLEWSEANQRVTKLAVELLGADAQLLPPNAPYGGHWTIQQLRSRGNTIEAGTSEILRNIVAERVLGLPRSR